MTIRMHIALLIILLATCVPCILYAQQWTRVTEFDSFFPSPTINHLVVDGGIMFAGAQEHGIFRLDGKDATWQRVSTIRAMDMLGLNGFLFVAAGGGGVHCSTDNGLSWNLMSSGLEGAKVHTVGNFGETLFAGADKGLFRSTDFGETWQNEGTGVYGSVSSFISHNEAMYVGTSKGVYRSTNGGDSYTQVKGSQGMETTAFCVMNDVFLVGALTGIYRWSPEQDSLILSDPQQNRSWSFASTDTDIFAGNYSDGIRRSSDNGATWAPITANLYLIQSLAVYKGMLYAGLYSRGMRKLPLAQALSDVAISAELQSMAVGPSVYPNPPVGRATIRYILGKPSPTTITIYDALGRIVSRPVVDVVQESGEHRIMLETAELAAGVYHCVVAAGDAAQTVRFVVAR